MAELHTSVQTEAQTILTAPDVQAVQDLRTRVDKLKVKWDDVEQKVTSQQVKFADAISQWQAFKCKFNQITPVFSQWVTVFLA